MICFSSFPTGGIGNINGNSPNPRPVGWFGALFPLFPITYLNVMNKGKKGNRTRENAYTRVKVESPIGNTLRKQRWST